MRGDRPGVPDGAARQKKPARQAVIALAGNINLRSFTGWDFRSGSGLLKTIIKTLFLAEEKKKCFVCFSWL